MSTQFILDKLLYFPLVKYPAACSVIPFTFPHGINVSVALVFMCDHVTYLQSIQNEWSRNVPFSD